MNDFEKLGVFYLGREKNNPENLLLYPSKHLTTHGIIVGMTGSGKTGLAIDLIEEAAIDGVPAILIDPKGDLADILLQFPELNPTDFRPWISEEEAARSAISPDELAAKTAEMWRKGLAGWGQDGERIRMLKAAADYAVYTPGDVNGRPIQLLSDFKAPEGADEATLRDSVVNSVTSLLGLVGIEADSVKSREHILLSAILYASWKSGKSLDLAQLVNAVSAPPFRKIGVFDIESFYPSKDRMKLALSLNGLLASPAFAAWRAGDPLDIQRLLWTEEGKPRISVLSISHLSDSERMFFVASLLNAMIAWMRKQNGTSSLRALLYMDEIFGYFPPNGNPPSKAPMLTLLKQARAFGLGVVLSTQNPVDLDYKGLSNCGTWFIGRLQTERDKIRVLDGLEGAAASSGEGFDREAMDRLLSGLGKRVFLMRDAAEDVPVLFETRWTMSYLCGPISSDRIKGLLVQDTAISPFDVEASFPSPFDTVDESSSLNDTGMQSPFQAAGPEGIAAAVRIHYTDAKTATDKWKSIFFSAPFGDGGAPDWSQAEKHDEEPASSDKLGVIPPRTSASWAKLLSTYVYQNQGVELLRDPVLKIASRFDESEGDFRVRVAQMHREKRDREIEKLTVQYENKLLRLQDRVRTAEDRLLREKSQMSMRVKQTALTGGLAALGALFGGRSMRSGIGRVGSTVRSAARIGKEKEDVARAQNNFDVLSARYIELEQEFEEALINAKVEVVPQDIPLERVILRPKKSDIIVENIWYI